MPKIANVIVNNPGIKTSSPFSYIITDEIKENIFAGSRVLVPFGKGNSTIEGYVVSIEENSQMSNLKPIYSVIDPYPLFHREMLELASWMKDQYMCTYLECLKCIAPTGISIKLSKTVILNKNFNISTLKGTLQKRIVEVLCDNNNELNLEQLKEIMENRNITSSLNGLAELGIVHFEEKLASTVSDKKLRIAGLNTPVDEATTIIDNLSERFSAQKRVINILLDNEYIAVSDLVKFADTSYSVVNSLHKKGIIYFDEIELERDPYKSIDYKTTIPLNLTTEQRVAFEKINEAIQNSKPEKFLIHGVTGSGKTEVYLQSIDEALKLGGQAIVLVPEISLTPQMVERFKARFGEQVAVIHSRLSLGERFDQWKKIRLGQVSVVVGARSAIFAPFDKLKLIIIDEEHETSYKSESKPKYHAKAVAEFRGQNENCVVVLGSATPSIETFYEAQQGIYKLLTMKTRANQCIMPNVEIIDMRKELEEGNRSIFSAQLFNEINTNISKGEQTILFLNRRGYSTFVSCRQCGFVMKCPNCNISLTYHSYSNTLICHYCGFERRNVSVCPSCSSKYIKYFGIGTQKVEEEVKKAFPNASVLRMDVDTTGQKFSHQRILDTFKNDNVNILIGTQMIAKGLDFPNVTLVGVISADTSLNIDDYRSTERTFQLLTQVAGRSGRGAKTGRVIIQTYQPDNFSILTAQNHDYETFYNNEIIIRSGLNYPPFVDIASIIISHQDPAVTKSAAVECESMLRSGLEKIKSSSAFDYYLFNATPAPLSKIKQMHRWRILAKISSSEKVRELLKEIESKINDKANISIDINSINML